MKKEMNQMKEQVKNRMKKIQSLRIQEITMVLMLVWGLYSLIFTKHEIDGSKVFELLVFQSIMVVFFMKRKSSSEMMAVLFLMTPYIYEKLVDAEYISLLVMYLLVGLSFYFIVQKKELDYKKSYMIFLVVYGVLSFIYTLLNKVAMEREGFLDDYYFMLVSGFSTITLMIIFTLTMLVMKKIKK